VSRRATYKNRQVVLDELADWPDGCRLLAKPAPEGESLGIREEDWLDTSDALEDWLRWYDLLEPLESSPEEEAAWQAGRRAQKDFEKVTFEERTEKLRRMWE
jgi:hypothetical protein